MTLTRALILCTIIARRRGGLQAEPRKAAESARESAGARW